MSVKEKLQYIKRLQILGEPYEVLSAKLSEYGDDVVIEFLLLPESIHPDKDQYVWYEYTDLLTQLTEINYQIFLKKYDELYE